MVGPRSRVGIWKERTEWLPLPVWEADPRGRISYINLAGLEALRYTREDFKRGIVIEDLLAPDERPVAARRLNRTFAGETLEPIEYNLRRKDGTSFPALVYSGRIADPDGEPAVRGVLVETTALRRAREDLRRSEELVQAIAEATTDSIFCKDLAFRYTFANRAMVELLGLDRDRVLGRTPVELFGQEGARTVAEVDEPSARGETVDSVRTLRVGPRERVFHTIQGPLRDAKGDVRGVFGIVRDVTEVRRAEERLRHSEKIEAIGHLAGGIAHDFNNQLTAILAGADLLRREGRESPHFDEYLETIISGARQSSALTRQLLAFARREKFEREAVDVDRLVRETTAMLERTLDPRISVSLQLAAADATVVGSPTLLQNVLLNLAINARDAMPAGGRILLRTASRTLDEAEARTLDEDLAAGAYVEVSVGDTGTGIAPDVLPHVFEPFFTTKRAGRGTGIGLAAAQGTVKSHGGLIVAESTLGVGSVFRVLLPLDRGGATAGASVEVTGVVTGNGEGVLLVDDDAAVLEATRAMAARLGYRAVPCRDPREALETFERRRDELDVVVVDLMMPEVSGVELIGRLRRLDPGVRVLATSGHADPETWRRLEELAVHETLSKPYSLARFSRALAAALRGRKGTRTAPR